MCSCSDFKKAFVDTDFLSKIFSSVVIDKSAFFKNMMTDLNIIPVIHIYCYEHEILASLKAEGIDALIEEGYITVIDPRTILHESLSEYRSIFETTFAMQFKKPFPSTCKDIFRSMGKNSMGELHCAIAARFLKYALILSDDSDTKDIVNSINTKRFQIEVYNLYKAFSKIAVMPKKLTKLNDVKNIVYPKITSHNKSSKPKEKYNKIKALWINT